VYVCNRERQTPWHCNFHNTIQRYRELRIIMEDVEVNRDFFINARMVFPTFDKLINLLESEVGLSKGRRMCNGVKMLLMTALRGISVVDIASYWQCSVSTLSDAIHQLTKSFLRLQTVLFKPPTVKDNSKF